MSAGERIDDFYDLVEEIGVATSHGSLGLLLSCVQGRFAGERRAYLERLVTARETALRTGRHPASVSPPGSAWAHVAQTGG